MKQFEQFHGWEDSDFEDYHKSKPLVSLRVIMAAIVSILLVLALVGVGVWLMGRL